MDIYILLGSGISTSWRTVYLKTHRLYWSYAQSLETIQMLSDDIQDYSKAIILTAALIQYTIIERRLWKQQNTTIFEHCAKFQGPLIKFTAACRYDLSERERALKVTAMLQYCCHRIKVTTAQPRNLFIKEAISKHLNSLKERSNYIR